MRRASTLTSLVLFVMLAVLTVGSRTEAFDAKVDGVIHDAASPAMTAAMRTASFLGSEFFLLPFAAVLVWRWRVAGRWGDARRFIIAGLSAEAATQTLKLLFHRTRPDVFFGLPPAETYSFPSGHSFVAPVVFFTAALIAGRGRIRTVLCLMAGVLALAIGFSRVYLGYHFASDVLGGFSLAAAWIAFFEARGESKRSPAAASE